MQPASLGAVAPCYRRSLRITARLVILCIWALSAILPTSRAQTSPLETPQQTNDRIRAFANLVQKTQHEYTIGPGDLLSVEVFDVKELSGDFRVSQAGSLALPLLPVRLQVSGLTEAQVEKKIAEVLEVNGLVSHPQVSIVAKEKKSKPITVMGAVAHPMVYFADRPVSLLEVLSEAGGISNEAGNTVIVTRVPQSSLVPLPANFPEWKDPAASSGPTSTESDTARDSSSNSSPSAASQPGPAEAATSAGVSITIRLEDLLDKADPRSNILLQGGDVVSVPRGGIVYVLGAVIRTGAYVLANDNSQMSVLKILSLAGGLQRTAKRSAAVILRKDDKGVQQQLSVDLGKIMARKAEDVPLSPNDILFVPESGGKRTAMRMAEIAIAVGSGAAVFRIAR